jgi:long-chain acyl-CoA synthetase
MSCVQPFARRAPETLAELSDYAAAYFGDAAALIDGESRLSFAQLGRLASCFSDELRMLGISRGDRVMLRVLNGWRWAVAYYGLLRTGAVAVPCNIQLTPTELEYIAGHSGATAIISDQAIAASDPLLISVSDWNLSDRLALAGQINVPLPILVHPRDPATIGYTSGTTGMPKGAVLSHRAIMASAAGTATMHMRARGEVVVNALPMSHVYGNIVLNTCVLVGMTLVSLPKFDVDQLLDAIEREKVTLFEGVPTMYAYILAHPDIGKRDLGSLRRCTVGGQTMPLAQINAMEDLLGCPLLELWGMTEVAGPAISHSPHMPARRGSIGLPMLGMEAAILSLEDGHELPTGEVGELAVRGPMVMDGYHSDPGATAEALDAQGWLRSGDVAFRDDEGFYTIVDRRKDMIITAGFNIYPAELERAIAQHPAVSMVAVSGVSDPDKGELAQAFVVPTPGFTPTEAELLQHCRGILAAYKVPRAIIFVEDLPKTSTGKILRRALRSSESMLKKG